jgi:hypothetical protein
VSAMNNDPVHSITESTFTILDAVVGIYVLVVAIMCYRFIRMLFNIAMLIRKSEKTVQGKHTIMKTHYNVPFSFFSWIFIPTTMCCMPGYKTIVEHEKVHSSQWHSIDLIIAELFCIAFWFNPFVFLLKRSLKSVHEYLADDEIIGSHTTLIRYINLLASGTVLRENIGIVNQFRCLTIKRLTMITKNKSSVLQQFAYLLIIPVIGLLVLAFSWNNSANNIPEINPVANGTITVHFGYEGINPVTKKAYTHGGIDIKVPLGTNVLASATGTVIEKTNRKDWGKLLIIKHNDEYTTWYAHLNDVTVEKGDNVVKGQVIGHVGNTGYSTGPHLHYEVRKHGEKVNPEEFFE